MKPGTELSATRRAVLDNIDRAVSSASPRPPELDLCPDGALRELLKSSSLYDIDSHVPTAPHDPDKLRVTKGDLRPQDASFLVGEDAAQFLNARLSFSGMMSWPVPRLRSSCTGILC